MRGCQRRRGGGEHVTKEQLLDALQRLMVETGSLACLGCGHEHNCSLQGCSILREAVASLREQEERRWIPVTERLPDKPMKCLVYDKRGDCGIYDIVYYGQGSYIHYSDTNYWMPLPEPPRENDRE